MASAEAPLTYHVVPRFDIHAQGGPLALGTVVSDIKNPIPLNRGKFHTQVPSYLIYPPVVHTNFKDTLIKARKANVKGWLKALGLPASASADVGGSKELENTVSCESIVTRYFDPDPAGDYVKKCLGVKSIRDWLEPRKERSVNLYIVTGLKVARKLQFNKSSTAELHVGVDAQMKEPNTKAVDVGVGGNVEGQNRQNLEFEVDDIVIGVRYNLYSCTKSLYGMAFGGTRETKDLGLLDGNMQDDREKAAKHPEIEIEQLLIPEETAAKEKAIAEGVDECWIGRND